MSRVFGIDLGTTYSCIAYIDEYGKAVVLKNSDGEHTTPSVVMAESADNIIVGKEAKNSIETDPDKTVQFIKRKMGREDDTIVLNGQTYHAPEISAMILKKLVQDANSELVQTGVLKDGEEIKDVVITCPAYFGMNERKATQTAGELAGLHVLNIINEPTAAAISYGVSKDEDETVLVYDLGGGTFDITVMNIDHGDIKVVCTGGDDRLGGKDWDEAFIKYVSERYEDEFDENVMEDPEACATLYLDTENWKKSLSTREKINVSVKGEAGRFREELTRKKYEEITESLLNRTKNLMDDVLKQAETKGYPLSRIDKILLVGGSSRMPQVAAMIKRDYGKDAVLADPDEAVAKGAALYAANEQAFNDFVAGEAARTGKSTDQLVEENLKTGSLDKKFSTVSGSAGMAKLNVKNVLSRTYGVDVWDGRKMIIENLLMINSELPATKTNHYGTVSHNQDGVDINLYESRVTDETMEIEDRKPLTTIHMIFQRPVPKGTEIKMTLALDNSGILHIYAKEELYGSELDTTFELSNQMSDSEISTAMARMSEASVE